MSQPMFVRSLLSVAVLGLSFTTLAGPAEHSMHHLSDNNLLLPPRVITAVAQQSPLTVITNPKQARQPIPASDAADYLKTIAGFSAIRSGGSNSDPVLRGMFGSRLKLLTNGGELLGACPSRMDSPSSYIAPQNFDQLTVTKGPQSVAWGPGASAGTIRFDRLPESFDEPGTRLDASVVAGSSTRRDLQLDGALGSREGYLRLTGNRSRSGDYRDGNSNRVPSRWNKWNTDLALGWTPDDDTLLELTVGAGDGEARYAGRGMDGSQFERESVGLRFSRDFQDGPLQKIEAQVSYNYADHVMDNYSLRTPSGMGMMANPMASNVDRRTLGGRLATTWQWTRYELLTGVDLQRNEHRKRNSRYDMMTGTLTGANHFAWDKDAGFHNYGVFGELSHELDSGNRWIGGARVDHAAAEDYRSTGPSAGAKRSDNLPSGFIRYEHDLQSLSATSYVGLGHVQRAADYWELFSGGVTAFETLNPEKTTQLDVGIQYKQGPMELWASGYVGQVRDYILFTYAAGMMPGMFSSTASNIDARIMGAETGIAYELDANWQTDVTLAWAWGKNSSDGEALPQMPPIDARFNLSYARNNWSAGALWRVVAAQSRTALNKGSVVGQDLDDSAGFGVLSVNAAYRFSQQVTLSAGLDNLANKTYAEHLNLAGNAGFGFPGTSQINEPGRTFWTKLDLSF